MKTDRRSVVIPCSRSVFPCVRLLRYLANCYLALPLKYRSLLTPVSAARSLLHAIDLRWPTEAVPFNEAAGRVLSAPIVADRDQPPFDRVAMDGIAIDYTAYAAGQRVFPVAWLQAAGAEPRPLTDPARCVEIMTGAALPAGVSTVIRYEDLTRQGDAFALPDGLPDGKAIHQRGKDITAGRELCAAGRRIGPAELGMLATCGYGTVSVVRQPRVAVVATGNELVPVNDKPLPHQIRMSNVYQLAQLLEGEGAVTTVHHYPDDPAALRTNLEACLQNNDLVVLSGWSSACRVTPLPASTACWLTYCPSYGSNSDCRNAQRLPALPKTLRSNPT